MPTDDAASAARAARLELDRLLETDAPALRAGLQPGVADRLERYVRLLLVANRRLNLTRIVEPAAVARLHLLDALAAVPLLDDLAPKRAIDIGSGGGVPAIPLALARTGVTWTLVESVGRKTDVLRSFVADLSLANVRVIGARAEDLGRDPAHRGAYDLVTGRACAALPVLGEYALPLLRPGGVMLAWKGPLGDDELATGRAAAALLGGSAPEVRAIRVEALGDHRFVLVRKVGQSPERYPRRPGEPARRPLA